MDLVNMAKEINTEKDQRAFFVAMAREIEELKKKKTAKEEPKQAFPPEDKMINRSSKK